LVAAVFFDLYASNDLLTNLFWSRSVLSKPSSPVLCSTVFSDDSFSRFTLRPLVFVADVPARVFVLLVSIR
jgi:hypothetical protein